MRGKKAKLARRMVADPLPAEANNHNLPSSGRLSRGTVMRLLTEHVMHDNGKVGLHGIMYSRQPSVIHEPNSVRAVYRKQMKSWVTARVS